MAMCGRVGLLPLGVAALASAVHWRTLFWFFSANDLVHLEQACGLQPTPHQPWRMLTQGVYFRLMTWLVGPWPTAFMAVNLALHAVNVVLFLRLLRRRGTASPTAALAGALFGACPLLSTVLGQAVDINDVLALALSLTSLDWLSHPGRRALVAGWISFIAAVLCKESVLFLPVLAVIPAGRPGDRGVRRRALAPIAATIVSLGAAFFVARAFGAAPAGAA